MTLPGESTNPAAQARLDAQRAAARRAEVAKRFGPHVAAVDEWFDKLVEREQIQRGTCGHMLTQRAVTRPLTNSSGAVLADRDGNARMTTVVEPWCAWCASGLPGDRKLVCIARGLGREMP